MSTAINNFTSQLHDNLEAVEDSPKATLRERAKALNKNIKISHGVSMSMAA